MEYIEVNDFENHIKRFFIEDDELLNTYHIVGNGNVDDCTNQTIKDLREQTDKSFRFFIVKENEEEIGYFGSEDINNVKIMTTIFVRPKHRTKEELKRFMTVVHNYFNAPYFTAVYGKNKRAIKFFLKNGAKIMKHFKHNDNHAFLFKFGEGPNKEMR